MFRHLMVDIVVNSSHGIRLGAVREWASGGNNILSTAMHDFPLLGAVVRRIPLPRQRCVEYIVSNSVALFPTWHGDLSLLFQIKDGAFFVTRTRYASDFLLIKRLINCFIDFDGGDFFFQHFPVIHEC
jgi:hypothetical protein